MKEEDFLEGFNKWYENISHEELLQGMDSMLEKLGIDDKPGDLMDRLRISHPYNSADVFEAVKLLGWEVNNQSETSAFLEPIGFKGETPILFNSIAVVPDDMEDDFFLSFIDDIPMNYLEYEHIILLTSPVYLCKTNLVGEEMQLLMIGVIYSEESMSWSWLFYNGDSDLMKQVGRYPCFKENNFSYANLIPVEEIGIKYQDIVNREKDKFLNKMFSEKL